MKFGLLLPHFGTHLEPSHLLKTIAMAERSGFDSAWVRDHVIYTPHRFEDPDPSWMDPFMVLSAVGAVTNRLILGTATLIPFRHPIHTAQLLASLASLVGSSRVLPAWGRGNDSREFVAVGAEVDRRGQALEEQVAIIRALWAGDPVDFKGEFFNLDGVQIKAPGLRGPIVHWYGGSTERAVRRTVEHFDGLLASRIPRSALKRRLSLMERLSDERGRTRPNLGLITLVSPRSGPSAEEVFSRVVPEIGRLYPEMDIRGPEDLEGAISVGGSAQIIEDVQAAAELGVSHFIFDLRLDFAEWSETVQMIAEEVLPSA